jgi:hypothetical protein
MDKMTANKEGSSGDFDMAAYTSAPLKLDMRIEFQGTSPADVFEVMGDPMRVKDWYLLAKEVHLHEPDADGQVDFDVEFILFGMVKEEIMHWDVPTRYVYRAYGEEFPLKGYVALIEVQQTGDDEGVMIWRQYFDEIDGDYNSRIVPVILPPLNEASLERLAKLIGGTSIEVKNFM